MAEAKALDPKEVAQLLADAQKNSNRIEEVLSASFEANAIKPIKSFSKGLKSMLQKAFGKEVPEEGKLENYFELVKALLYGNVKWQLVVRQIAQNSKGMGVCAKVLKAGDVAWKCEDCEKDSTCIICQECFEKADHKGHKVWLKTNVSGCCDCGDPDAWAETGFCSEHRGFAASTDAMLSSLPKTVRQNSPLVFTSLAKSLKGVLLELATTEIFQDNYAQLVQKIFLFFEQCCDESPSNIHFISQALLHIFYGDFEAKKGHTCCYRYFVREE